MVSLVVDPADPCRYHRAVLLRDRSTAYESFCRMVDGPMLVLSVLWLPVFLVPLLFNLAPSVSTSLQEIDYVIWAIFVAEYFTKLLLAPARWSFVKSHPLDLLTVALPMLRPLRVLRLLRFVRAFSLSGEGLTRGRSLLLQRGLLFLFFSALFIVFAGAGLCLAFEAHAKGSSITNYGSALWWAVSTISTVGYGDKVPVTPGGRGVAVVLMIAGLGVVGGLSATLTSFFVQQRREEVVEDVQQLRSQINNMNYLLTDLYQRLLGSEEVVSPRTNTGYLDKDGRARSVRPQNGADPR